MNEFPTKIERPDDDSVLIEWSSGQKRVYSNRELRQACPGATCREKRSSPPQQTDLLPILSPAEAQPLRIDGMKPVGQYAYSIAFSDGHDTGIYNFELLRSLGDEAS